MSAHPRRQSAIAFAAYLTLSVLFFAGSVVLHPHDRFIGETADPELFLWNLAWWPHAIAHGMNPFVTSIVWSPLKINLAWVTSVPGLALVLTPLTVLAGPVLSYNVAALAMPALAAWTAFLLCRYVTRSFWPSLAGGYLFGFSSYMIGQLLRHLHLSSVFLVPLVALVVLRYLDGSFGRRGLALRLGLLLAGELWLSTEVFFTLSVALVTSLALGALVAPARRARIRAAIAPVAGAYALAAVLAAPLIAYAISGFESKAISNPRDYPTDLANPVVPTETIWLSTHWTLTTAREFLGNRSEQGAYLGLPLVLLVGWFLWTRRKTAGARFLAAALVVGFVCELGNGVYVAGHRLAPAPWRLVSYLPGFDNVLPSRLSMYVALAAAVAVALWAANSRASVLVRGAIVLVAIAFTLPDPTYGNWRSEPIQPAFFTAGIDKRCLTPNATVLVLPYGQESDAMMWQAETGFRWRLADGYLRPGPPASLPYRNTAVDLNNSVVPPASAHVLRALIRFQHVTAVIVAPAHEDLWQPLVAKLGLGPPQEIGGIELYRVGRGRPCA